MKKFTPSKILLSFSSRHARIIQCDDDFKTIKLLKNQ